MAEIEEEQTSGPCFESGLLCVSLTFRKGSPSDDVAGFPAVVIVDSHADGLQVVVLHGLVSKHHDGDVVGEGVGVVVLVVDDSAEGEALFVRVVAEPVVDGAADAVEPGCTAAETNGRRAQHTKGSE